MDIQQKIGKRIRELRKEKGLSQEAFADLARIDRTYVNSVENGKRNISLKNIEKIANAFNISISNFFYDDIFSDSKKK